MSPTSSSALRWLGGFERHAKLGSLFAHLGENSLDKLPVKADLRGAASQLVGFKQCWKASRNAIQDGRNQRF